MSYWSVLNLSLLGIILLLGSCRGDLPETQHVNSTDLPSIQKAFSLSTLPALANTSTYTPGPSSMPDITLFPTHTPIPSFTPEQTVGACLNEDLHGISIYLDENPAVKLRQGPGCEYPPYMDALEKPDPLSFFTVLGRTGEWWLVDICSESPVWVFGPAIWPSNLRGESESLPNITKTPLVTITTSISSTPFEQQMVAEAGDTLVAFFSSLQAKEYNQAVPTFAGGYGIVRNWNPDVDPQDFPALLRRGCEWNGFICSLSVNRILASNMVSAMEFHITVEFLKEDGQLFQLYNPSNPDAPPQTSFTFTVIRDCEGHFFVVDWPIFTG